MKWELSRMMNPEIKKMWLDALRSDKYKQTTCELETVGQHTIWDNDEGNIVPVHIKGETGYCCLGVLANELMNTGKGNGFIQRDNNFGLFCLDMDGKPEHCMLTPAILNNVGLTTAEQDRLATMNDEGSSFTEIADHIEKML